ncbi:MAG: sigma-70 family RNA polymerase sigma factor [Phycisphaerae bacterium]
MDPDVTRISLLSRVRNAADQAAWVEFEARYRELILRYALARGLQHADAEDVRQIVMMSLSTALRGFRYSPERGRFRHYLGRVVRNAVARLKARPNQGAAVLDSYVGETLEADDGIDSDSVWEQEWVDHHYRLALHSLRETFDPRSIEVFEQLVSGGSVAETAADFGMSQQAVHKVKQRARDRMRELVAAQIRDEDEADEPRGG